MNDRMKIAAMVMQGMMANSSIDIFEPAEYASDAVRYADALLKALAESEAFSGNPNDPGPVARAFQRKQMWDTLANDPGPHDEVGDWRKYVRPDGKRALMHVAAGNMAYVDDAFYWNVTPQEFNFWDNILFARCSDADKARARDFARRVLEAMEAEGE